ncbi:unnamed protein product [Closterium sp. NIES-65]|nr:unnamed protein product [Closterium sp. NIES-65]
MSHCVSRTLPGAQMLAPLRRASPALPPPLALTAPHAFRHAASQRESTRRRVAVNAAANGPPPPEAASPRPSEPEPAGEPRGPSNAAAPSSGAAAPVAASWAAALAGVEVMALDGTRVALTSLWATRRVVVAWTRHFGCLLCRKLTTMLANEKDAFQAAGVTLIIIGPGSIQHAQQFVDQTNFPGEVYADRQRASYEALQFVSGLSTVFSPTAALSVARARMEGFQQDWGLSLQADTVLRAAWQQGGIIVAGPGIDNLLFLHKDKEAGDEPDVRDIIAAARLPLP